jgi:putative sterol carrier protein
VSKWLSPEWFDETRAMRADLAGPAGLSARIQFEITGGPDRDARYHWVLEDGRMVSGAEGAVDDPDVTLTMVWDDALAMQRGDLDPNVAFMRGRLKVVGSMSVMVALLPLVNRPEYQDLRRRIVSVTQF